MRKQNVIVILILLICIGIMVLKLKGRIKFGDTGFSINCHRDDALRILNREACILGADAANLLDETRPNFWSTCYRVDAEFLKRTIDVNKIQEPQIWEVGSEQKPEIYLMNRRLHSMRSKLKGTNSEHARLTGNVPTAFLTFLHETHWERQ